MSHELNMPEPAKVVSVLDECIDVVLKIKNTITTTAEIGKMGLKIGGLDKAFISLEELNPDIDDSLKVFKDIQEQIETHAKTFEAMNEDITY